MRGAAQPMVQKTEAQTTLTGMVTASFARK